MILFIGSGWSSTANVFAGCTVEVQRVDANTGEPWEGTGGPWEFIGKQWEFIGEPLESIGQPWVSAN